MSTNEKPDIDINFYNPGDPELSDEAKRILVEYSGIPEDRMVQHVRDVRDKAFKVFKYPCIGRYGFMDFSIGSAPEYKDVLPRLRAGATLLDLGCCFGQDVRKLVYEGVPSENLCGLELESEFIDLGYELLCDKNKLKAKFFTGDFLDPTTKVPEQAFDFIHAASFFHLFSWTEQVDAISRALGLLKPVAGSMIFGRQTSMDEAKEMQHHATRSGVMFVHNKGSFLKLINEVAERSGIGLKASVHVHQEVLRVDEYNTAVRMLNFSITRQ